MWKSLIIMLLVYGVVIFIGFTIIYSVNVSRYLFAPYRIGLFLNPLKGRDKTNNPNVVTMKLQYKYDYEDGKSGNSKNI